MFGCSVKTLSLLLLTLFYAVCASAVQIKFHAEDIYSMAAGGGYAVGYSLTLAGTTLITNYDADCGARFYSPSFSADLAPDTVYTGELILTKGLRFCYTTIMVDEYPECYELVGDVISHQEIPPDYTYHYFTIELRSPTNPWPPLLSWTVRDGSGREAAKPTQGGVYKMRADGMSTATYTNIDPSRAVSVEFIGNTLGCILTNSTLFASTNTGTVRLKVTSDSPTCAYEEATFELTQCEPCDSGDCGDFGSLTALNNSVDVRIGLGFSAQGNTAGFLHLKADTPSITLTRPAGLSYTFFRSDVHVVREPGVLRQVKTPEGLANIITNTSTKYFIDLYNLTNVLAFEKGLYVVTNSYIKRITVEQGATTNDLKITDSGSGIVHEYNWLGNGWELSSGSGLRKQTKTVTFSETNTLKTVTNTIRQGAGAPVFHAVQKYRTNLFSERLIEEVIGTGQNAITNSYKYTTNGFLQQANRGDGSWEYYFYDSLNRPTNIFSGFKNELMTTNRGLCRLIEHDYTTNLLFTSGDDGHLDVMVPRCTVESLTGKVVSVSYSVIHLGERLDIRCVSGTNWNSQSNLVTTTKYYTNGLHRDRIRSILRPDGILEMYLYGSSLTNTTNVVLRGHPDSSGTNIDAGTKTISIIGALGQVTSRTEIDFASTFPISRETYAYDSANRLTSTTYLDGTAASSSYDCCTLSSTTDRDGTVASYTYDAIKRRVTSTRNGITLSNILDAAGNVLQTVRYGTNGSAITVQTSTFDDAGRLISSQDALSSTTSYTNYLTANGFVKTTTYPNLSTRTETYFFDGRPQQVSGTAVHGVRYDYGPTNTGAYAVEVKLLANGSDSLESALRVSDMAGRLVEERFADGAVSRTFFNTNGQVKKTIDPDGVTTLFEYDSLGELEYRTVDMNGDGRVPASNDRIIQTISDVANNATYAANVLRRRTYVWPDNSSSTSRLLATAETSVDGLTNWTTLWNNGAAVVSSTRISYSGGHRYVTETLPDNTSTVRDFQNGRLLSETRKDANGNQIIATSYTYDPHGRVLTSVDARNGATTFAYDNNDRQTSITISNQTTASQYNNMGWVTNVVPPDTSIVGTSRTEYHPTGEVATNWGARTYPVAYTYDHAGRMKTMTTWTNFAARAGSAVTTWNYDAYRGFLTNKAHADGTGPLYAYTPAGRLQSRTWARSVTCTYGTNAAGDIATITYTGGTSNTSNLSYTFDRLGRVKQVDQGTNVTTLAYNDLGQLTGETFNGIRISNVYSAALLRTNLQFLIGSSPQLTNAFTYDPAARLQTVSDGTYSGTYAYHTNSHLLKTLTFKQTTTERIVTYKDWDNLNRLSAVHSSNSVITSFRLLRYFGYDDANQRTFASTLNTIDNYQYDSLGQLTVDRRGWLSPSTYIPGEQFYGGYDDMGNRTFVGRGGDQWLTHFRYENYTANNLNQYTRRTVPGKIDVSGSATNTAIVTVNNQATYRQSNYFRKELSLDNSASALWQGITNVAVVNVGTNYDIVTNITGNVFLPKTPELFAYDADGNLTNDGRWGLTWDAENRLIRMTAHANLPTGARLDLQFAYDHQGRRISKVVSNWTGSAWAVISHTRFVYDAWNLISELNGTNNAVVRMYMWGSDLSGTMQGAGGVGGLLAIKDAVEGAHFVHYDGNGNVSALVNGADGIISAEYEYSPFGELLRVDGAVAKLNPIRFSTTYRDDETEWSCFPLRFYDTALGRWANRDPIAEMGGLNMYAFVANNPISSTDVLGLAPKECIRTLVMGHLTSLGLQALDSFLASKPGTGCDASKIGFLTCGSGYLTSALPKPNQLPLPPDLLGVDMVNKVSKIELREANNIKRGLPNLASLPPMTQKNTFYGGVAAPTAMLAFNQIMEDTKKECNDKNKCCSSFKVVVKCSPDLSDEIDRHLTSWKDAPQFKGASNPCRKEHEIKCP